MDAAYEGQWNVNIVRLEALRQNIPSLIGENIVRDYNAIVHALQVASHDENIVHFRIPDTELKPRVVSVQRAGRRSPGRTNYSKDNYCDSGLFERQLQALWGYIQKTDPLKKKEPETRIGNVDMNLLSQCNEKVTVERHDNSRYENVPALVSSAMILIPDAKIPIEPNDAILRATSKRYRREISGYGTGILRDKPRNIRSLSGQVSKRRAKASRQPRLSHPFERRQLAGKHQFNRQLRKYNQQAVR